MLLALPLPKCFRRPCTIVLHYAQDYIMMALMRLINNALILSCCRALMMVLNWLLTCSKMCMWKPKSALLGLLSSSNKAYSEELILCYQKSTLRPLLAVTSISFSSICSAPYDCPKFENMKFQGHIEHVLGYESLTTGNMGFWILTILVLQKYN